jgi:hypothetical protein
MSVSSVSINIHLEKPFEVGEIKTLDTGSYVRSIHHGGIAARTAFFADDPKWLAFPGENQEAAKEDLAYVQTKDMEAEFKKRGVDVQEMQDALEFIGKLADDLSCGCDRYSGPDQRECEVCVIRATVKETLG